MRERERERESEKEKEKEITQNSFLYPLTGKQTAEFDIPRWSNAHRSSSTVSSNLTTC